ncbi:uncharacterized protein SPPG_03842 [Spizellomyces punctatus DAOM BR117]|uniref:sn-1-specific diacylglycerol lipase n=1 Tax=Spizellomyces punctatus (strain DAOM BR117) TaxID=645134 RepID=A0A0L0HGY9_SPIPD|nr:uncharacterized protein SPPG_03842 [Spizellomyces punctatus DAOM BR117]KND00726.1 hypothetical protein SPPG_03842 [Spizellomyces punctatus DAOM BR117]|eukprot:XP_016608765.1 hypothetical protein SPPG_03842 [Spizellomyces punctatus DAOM BR117]
MHDSACPEVVLVIEEAEEDAGDRAGTDVSLLVGTDDKEEAMKTEAALVASAVASTTLTAAASAVVGCTDLALRVDTSSILHHHNHRPLLDRRIAALISSISTGARISLRLASILVEAIFESLKFSASTSLAITRRAMVAAVSSARTLHLIAMGRGKSDSVSFFKVLDRYTSAGVYVIHNVFSLAELLTHTTFHLASSTIRFSLNAAEEFVQVLDGLFGETETSKALAAFVCLVKKELEGTEEDLCLGSKYGRISALGQITKAMTAYCCLQYVNRNRWRNSLKLTAIFEGHIRPSEVPEDSAAKSYSGLSDCEINSPSDLGEMGMAELHAIASGTSQLLAPLTRNHILGPMDRRRMSNPERFSSLALRLIDLEGGRSGVQTMTREDSGYGEDPTAAWPEKPQNLAEARDRRREHRHGSVTPDGRRQRAHSGQSGQYKLDHAQVNSVLRMLESVQFGRSQTKSKRSTKWENSASLPKAHRDGHGRHARPKSDNIVSTDGSGDPRQKLFENIARYVRFASGAYGTNFLKILGIGRARDLLIENCTEHHNHQSFAFHTDVPVEHIITSSFRKPSALHPPALIAPVHYLVVDAKSSAVVVSLRGTLGLSDLITDLTSNYASYETVDGVQGKVHAGMLASAEKIARGPVRDAVVEALNKHPNFGLVLTGHSLGGGVAALLALIWSRKCVGDNGEEKFFTSEEKGFPSRPVHCFVYGVPAVMSLNLSSHCKDLITSVIYRHDVVPCLSLGLIRDFRNVAVNLCNEQGMAERVIGKVLGVFKNYPGANVPTNAGRQEGPGHEDELWYWALLKTLRADMRAEKLYPPGSVYWLDATTPVVKAAANPVSSSPTVNVSKARIATALTVHAVDDVEVAFSEFTFSRTMFIDHSPHSYERALQSLMVAMKTHQWG